MNINEACGSTHPEAMAEKVVEVGADVGIAFDGDGDRVVMADHDGNLVDGDELLYVIARHADGDGRLRGGVVGTLMSNLGLERALEKENIPFARTDVGDRFVIEAMRRLGWWARWRVVGPTSFARSSRPLATASSRRCRSWSPWSKTIDP